MNDNQNEPKQLESTLKCTASSKCCKEVEKDLSRPDKNIASLLENDEQNETEVHEQAGD